MRKILHIADLHLGFAHRYLDEHAASRAEEAVQTLERVVEWAIDSDHEVGAVLIAGDLFETHEPDSQLLGRVMATLKRIPTSGRTLVTVPGNHDEYSYPESVYRQQTRNWPGVLVTSPTFAPVATFELGGHPCTVYSLAFTAGLSGKVLTLAEEASSPKDGSATRPGAAASPPGIRIALLHGTLDADPTDRTYRIDSATLAKGSFSYAALGHIHKPAESRFGDGIALYPGTLNGKGFDDPGTPELVLVSFPGGRPRIERVPFPTREIRTQKVDLGRYETQEDLVTALERDPAPQAIVRLALEGFRPEDFDAGELLGRLAGSFHHLEISDRSLEIPAEEIERLEQQPTVKGLFVQLMRRRIADAQAVGDQKAVATAQLALEHGLAAFESVRRGH
ncbi:MAG: DNA repair exonuclease [Candidatus Eisenbacteria sp.]|nr:DNA repair exonuclease [Candidatus Eisenbacteria bacterium]